MIRQVHRWLSLAFSVAVIANIAALAMQSQATWLGFLALLPLIPLLFTGAVLFVQPYLKKSSADASVRS